jgi:hypothetical protein
MRICRKVPGARHKVQGTRHKKGTRYKAQERYKVQGTRKVHGIRHKKGTRNETQEGYRVQRTSKNQANVRGSRLRTQDARFTIHDARLTGY